jgi:hypothetical protein
VNKSKPSTAHTDMDNNVEDSLEMNVDIQYHSPTYQVGLRHGSMPQLQHSLVVTRSRVAQHAQCQLNRTAARSVPTNWAQPCRPCIHPHRPIPLPFVSSSLRRLLRKAGKLLPFLSDAGFGAISRLLSCSSPLMPLHTTAWQCSPSLLLYRHAC